MTEDREPEKLTVDLLTSSISKHISSVDSPQNSFFFTDFYFPDAAKSIKNVFGLDLSTPLGKTKG